MRRGRDASVALADTWEWDGAKWTPITTPTSPGRRSGHTMVYDPARKAVLLYGGYSAESAGVKGDLWSYDGAKWTQLYP